MTARNNNSPQTTARQFTSQPNRPAKASMTPPRTTAGTAMNAPQPSRTRIGAGPRAEARPGTSNISATSPAPTKPQPIRSFREVFMLSDELVGLIQS